MPKQNNPDSQPDPTKSGSSRGTKVVKTMLGLGLAGGVAYGASQIPGSAQKETTLITTAPANTPRTTETTLPTIEATTTTTSTPPSTTSTTESGNQLAAEALKSEIQQLIDPTVGDTFTVLIKGMHITEGIRVYNQPTSEADGAKQYLGGFTGNITQGVVVNGPSGNFVCFYTGRSDLKTMDSELSITGVGCINTNESNTREFLSTFDYSNPNVQAPFNPNDVMPTSQVTVNAVNGTPTSAGPGPFPNSAGNVYVGGFNVFPNENTLATG